jgi:protocatechuate 4,5-dioxygenase, alpha chain
LSELASTAIRVSYTDYYKAYVADTVELNDIADESEQLRSRMRQAVEEATLANDYDDIPGTFVFDAQRSRQGYGINMFCMSLLKEENRREFRAGEEEYLSRFPLTRAQKDTILHREWNRMLELGGNIYFIAKLAATDGFSFSQVAAMMTGSTQQEYTDMMLKGGRPVEGNRNKSDWNQHG